MARLTFFLASRIAMPESLIPHRALLFGKEPASTLVFFHTHRWIALFATQMPNRLLAEKVI
jgi:hypothetical protein